MHNARIRVSVVLWFLLCLTVMAQPLPPFVRSVLDTNLCPFGLTGQALFRTAGLPYLNWSNITVSGGDMVLSNYVVAISNLQWQSDNIVSNWANSISNLTWTGDNSVSNWVNAVSNAGWAGNNVVSNWCNSVSNLTFGSANIVSNWVNSVSNSVWNGDNIVSNWVNSVSNLLVTGGSGAYILSLNGQGTNGTFNSSASGKVPLVISNTIGNPTNSFEVPGTNGITGKSVVVTSDGRVGIGTNLPQALLHITGTNGPNRFLVQVEAPNALLTNAWVVKTNGFVGIGADPSDVLEVNGNIRLTAAGYLKVGANNNLYLSTADIEQSFPFRGSTAGKPALFAQTYATTGTNAFQLQDSTQVPQFCVSSNWNAGLGTNYPQSRLHVTADNSAANVMQWGTTNYPVLGTKDTNGGLHLYPQVTLATNAFEVVGTNGITGKSVVVTADGKVGIGTNLPQALFHMRGTNGPSQYIVQVENPMIANHTNAFTIGTNDVATFLGTINAGVALNVANGLNAGGGISSTGNVSILGSSTLNIGSSTVDHFTGGIIGIYRQSTNFFGLIFGTNSTSGTNMPALRTFGTGFSNTPIPTIRVVSQGGAGPANLEVSGTLAVGTNIVQKGDVAWPKLIVGLENGGPGIPHGCFGNLKMSDTNIVQCPGADLYTNACGTNFTSIATNGFYGALGPGDSAALTNLYAGWYRISIALSYMGANATSYEVGVFTNLVECTELEFKDTFDTPARTRNGSMTGTIYLPANCRTSMKIKDFGAGTTIAVTRASINIGTP